MVEWWQNSLSLHFPTSKDCLIEICWGMTPQTVPSSSCIFSVPCRLDRTSRRFLALPLHEPPPSRQVDFLALHLLLGSSLEIKKNPIFLSFFSDIQIRPSNYFTARAIGSLSTWANFYIWVIFRLFWGVIWIRTVPNKRDSAFGHRLIFFKQVCWLNKLRWRLCNEKFVFCLHEYFCGISSLVCAVCHVSWKLALHEHFEI